MDCLTKALMHYFNFQIKEWVANTAHLSPEEEGIYLRLVNYYYDSEKPIPLAGGNLVNREFSATIRKLRLTQHLETVEQILLEFFTETEAGWIHKRCDIEIAKYKLMADAGKRGAEKRWQKTQSIAPVIAPLLELDSPPNDPPMLIKNKELKINNKYITPDGFDLFWNAYGYKTGKPNAIKEWVKLKADKALQDKICKQAEQDRKAKPDNKYRKHPERWLKYKGWEDEIVSHETLNKELPLGTDAQIEHAYRTECGGDPSRARFNSYAEMRKFVQEFRDRKLKQGPRV